MKKSSFIMLFMIGILLFSTNTVRAQEKDEHYKGDYFYANGKTVTITERTDSKEGAHVKLSDGKEYDLDPWVTIYGGSYDGVFENTEIIMNGGTVADIYGGGSGQKSKVTGTAKVTINGGTVGWTGKKISYVETQDKEYGGFVYGGANNGGYVEKSEVVINVGTKSAIKHAVIASGNTGSETKSANIIVNNGSWLTVAHAIYTAKVGNAKITINGGKTIFIYNGYYYAEGANSDDYNGKVGDAESFETELWNSNYTNIYVTGVKGENGDTVSANTKTKFSYLKGVKLYAMDFYKLGQIYAAKEVIPYITLNLHYGDNVVSKRVPQGKVSKDVIDELKGELTKNSGISSNSILDLYLDEALNEEYNLDKELGMGADEISADLYLKVTAVEQQPTVEQQPNENVSNPDTVDNIFKYVSIFAISGIAIGFFLKKRFN